MRGRTVRAAPTTPWPTTPLGKSSETPQHPGSYTSKEDFLSNVIRPFNARMASRLIPMIRNIYADGDTVIVFFDAEGTARDGLPYRNTYSWFLTLREGKIVRASAFFDSLAFNDLWQRVTPVPNP
jgi:uncharacterized protein